MRLDKYLASTTDYSRSQIKKLIKAGQVSINQQPAQDPGQHINVDQDRIDLYQQTVTPLAPRYFMLNKPTGFICATQDSEQLTVIDLLSSETNSARLHIAGRLDKDTTGLVLITDDGQWSHRITSPHKHCFKYYRVTVANALTEELIPQFQQGVLLKGETKPTQPAKLKLLDHFTAELAIQEGKYHQVKRMFAATGNKVTALHRTRVGPILLDTKLAPGDYRPLTADEIQSFSDHHRVSNEP